MLSGAFLSSRSQSGSLTPPFEGVRSIFSLLFSLPSFTSLFYVGWTRIMFWLKNVFADKEHYFPALVTGNGLKRCNYWETWCKNFRATADGARMNEIMATQNIFMMLNVALVFCATTSNGMDTAPGVRFDVRVCVLFVVQAPVLPRVIIAVPGGDWTSLLSGNKNIVSFHPRVSGKLVI
jgi:hypothetical protein